MTSLDTLLANFETVAEATDGVQRLRRLILHAAITGRLVPQNPGEPGASTVLMEARATKGNTLADSIRGGASTPRVPTAEECGWDLPSGWAWARIDDTGEYVNGLAFKNSDWQTTGIPIVRIQNLTNPEAPFNYGAGPFPEDRMVADGDILVSWSATLNAFRWDRGPAVVNQHIFKVIPDNRVVRPDFLFHLLRHSIQEMAESEAAHGLVMKHINRGPFLSHVVGLPPLAEQDRIVSEVNRVLAICERLERSQAHRRDAQRAFRNSATHALTHAKTQEHFNRAWDLVHGNWPEVVSYPEDVSEMEAGILQLAVLGRLTSTRSTTVREGRELPEEPDEQLPRLPPGWRWEKLQELVDPERKISYGVIKLGPDPGESGVPILRCSDVRRMWIDRRSVRHIEQDLSDEYGRTLLRGGELLVNVRGTLGGCAVVPADMAGHNIAREVAVVPTVGIDPTYLLYVLASKLFLDYTASSLRGTAYKGLNLSLLREFPVPVPPVTQQAEVVQRVSALREDCERLRSTIEAQQSLSTSVSQALVAAAV